MHYVLTEAIKRRILLELRRFWALDPKYRDSLVPNIQGKYSFEERPQQAIILKGASANPVRFAADNYQGLVVSYCHLFRAYGKNGTSVEWIKEDARAIQDNNSEFPSAPGIYYLEIREEVYDWKGVPDNYLVFYVDPLFSIFDEMPTEIDALHYTVGAGAFHPGSLVVYSMPGNLRMYEGVNYTANPETGEITLARPVPDGTRLSVDYYYAGESLGPFPVEENGANNSAIPGVVLAFGRRAYDGDVMAVLVSRQREASTREFGGRFEMSLDLDLMARDVYAQGEICDRTLMYLQSELRDRLSFDGIEIDQVSFGGESEEVYDENGDDYFYNGSISLTVYTDWSVRVPLTSTLRRILPGGTVIEDQVISAMSDEQIAANGVPGGLVYMERLGLESIQDPWFLNRARNYEMIR